MASNDTTYDRQWRVFDEAQRLGWTGDRPGVLGTYAADKALTAAREFIQLRKDTQRGS